ncbi:MAG: magnesium transporter CorA family protein, partial [Oscillospiraceae bacterium]|nr:magnesium transporter CorA family protein [Oscillospiraceae bacterium]
MLRFYKTLDGQMLQIPEEQSGCWIRVLAPSVQETEYLIHDLGLDPSFVTSSLDEEETSRIEQEGDQTFVVIDFPYRSVDEEGTV